MKIKQTIVLMIGALLMGVAPMIADEATNLISNPGFEEYKESTFMGMPAFELMGDWSWSGSTSSFSAEKTDKIEGNVSLKLEPTINSYLDQGVALPDADYAKGTKFELIIHYKVLSLPAEGNLSLDCYWEAAGGGDSEAAKAQDADQLQRVLETEVNSDWKEVKVITTKPAKTAYFRVRVKASKSAKVLLDDFSLKEKPSTDPYITVTPDKLTPVSVNIGEEKAFQTLKIKQGNVTSETTFAITGANPDQFTLSATSLPASESELDLVITYKPKAAGNHKAALVFDNVNHTTALPNSISLQGSCSDPTKKPEIQVTPTSITDFQAVVGTQQKKNLHIVSLNCTSELTLKMEHVQGAAFTCLSSGLAQNMERDEPITFSPLAEGEYESKLTISTEGGDPVVVTLKGKAEKRSEENIDWLVDFSWDMSSPLAILNETFDNVEHNKTLTLSGWQNVAKLDERPWWGFDEAATAPVRGENKYAKATAYQYGKASTGKWEMWLVTPALDYKNAGSKIFTFSVMCEYQPDDGSDSKLEVYYIDANIDAKKDTVFFQDLTESFEIPQIGDENLTWRTFQLDLSPYAETMADIFHIGFRFVGPNGNEGVPTYYIDDVSWGRTDLPVLSVTPSYIIDSAAVVGKELIIGELTISGKNLTDDIELKVSGSNYNRFSLSTAKLSKEGGSVLVSFLGLEAGVHEAYVEISSKDAATKFVPMAVRCNAEQGIESIQDSEVRIQKVLRNGQVIIVRDGKEYSILGVRLL